MIIHYSCSNTMQSLFCILPFVEYCDDNNKHRAKNHLVIGSSFISLFGNEQKTPTADRSQILHSFNCIHPYVCVLTCHEYMFTQTVHVRQTYECGAQRKWEKVEKRTHFRTFTPTHVGHSDTKVRKQQIQLYHMIVHLKNVKMTKFRTNSMWLVCQSQERP